MSKIHTITVSNVKEFEGKRIRIMGICPDTDWKDYNHALGMHHHLYKEGVLSNQILFDDGTATNFYWGLQIQEVEG